MARIQKRYFIPGILLIILAGCLFFASTFTKDYLVKNSEKLIGRKLTIGEMHFNYFKVSLQVKDLVLFEPNKTDSFASFSEFYINLNPWTLLANEYSVSEIRIADPRVNIIQDGEKFNFDSLKPRPDSTAIKDTTKSSVLKFTIRNIQLINGNITYNDLQKKNRIDMKNMKLNLPLISWNNEKSDMGVDFVMGEKGKVNIQATVDNLKKKYQIALTTQDIDIKPISGYLTDYFELKLLKGYLTSNLLIVGDMSEVINVSIKGKGRVSDFSVIDGNSQEILSSPEVNATLKDINLKTFHFGFGKIEASQPHLKFVREKNKNNLMQFLAPYFRSDSISSTTSGQAEEQPVTYSNDSITVKNGLISISDLALNRPFSYELNNLNMTMTGLTESAEKIPVVFSTQLNNRGEFSGKATWSMVDFMNVEMDANVKRMDLISFSPYTEYYIASPVTQGWFNYQLGLKMSSAKLTNSNKVKVQELEFGKRTKDTTAMKVPVRLALYLMKDANDLIEFDIPVEGNPSEPKFKLGKIIWKTFANLMVKTALSPFKALGSLAGTNPESMDKLPFEFAQDSLNQDIRDALTKLATILKKKPELVLSMIQSTDPEKEKARIAIELTKSEYLSTIPADQALPLKKASSLPNDDINLLGFIRKTVPALDSLGIEAACLKRLSMDKLNSRFQEILNQRNRLVSEFMTVNQGIPNESVQISTIDFKNLPEELKVPQFKIEVSVK